MDSGNVSVVTGASRGIGREVALNLSRFGGAVVIVARDSPRLTEASDYVKSKSPNSRVIAIPADLSRMADVHRLAEEISKRFEKVTSLIHAAAVILARREVTDEGFEKTFVTNTMAPLLLSHLLFDRLRTAGARVILFYGGGRSSFDPANLLSDHGYDGWIAYNQSKNADVMIALELAQEWHGTGVTVNCVFPGLVNTTILGDIPRYMRIILAPIRTLLRSSSQGAIVPVWAATAPELTGVSGKLFGSLFGDPRREFSIPRVARNPDRRRQLFDQVLEWTGLRVREDPAGRHRAA